MQLTRKPQTTGRAAIDFAILTILDHERDAMVRHLSEVSREREPADPTTYYRGRIGVYDVVVVQQSRMGNVEAATSVARLMARYEPQAVLVVGIAAGDEQKVTLGDVAVSSDIAYVAPGKLRTDELGQAQRDDRPRQFPASEFLQLRARDLLPSWNGRLPLSPDGNERKPKVVRGVIAAEESVIANRARFNAIKKQIHGLVALAMEGGGAAIAIHANHPKVGLLEIRGICDYADERKNDHWQVHAAEVAAAFAAMLLEDLDLLPVSASPRVATAPVIAAVRLMSVPVDETDVLQLLHDEGFAPADVSIDLSGLGEPPDGHRVAEVVKSLTAQGSALKAAVSSNARVAVYGHAPIPIAALVGYIVGSRRQLRLFDCHRFAEKEPWRWPNENGEYPALEISTPAEIEREGEIVMRISVSSKVRWEDSLAVSRYAEADTELEISAPRIGAVASEAQAKAYAAAFREQLDHFNSFEKRVTRLHVCCAVPVSVAVALGSAILPTVDPPVIFWQYDAGYQWGLDVSAASQGFINIEWAEATV